MQKEFFPTGVAVAIATREMWHTPVLPEEECLLSPSAAPKRLREFRAGRHCAHLALQQLGQPHSPLLRGEHGEPLWPENICGSISHAGERCVAIAAKCEDYLSIAVDVERDRFIKGDTLERISHPGERQLLEQGASRFAAVNLKALLFGMKECVHKIYYPLNYHTLDFQDVEVTPDWEQKTFAVRILVPRVDAAFPLENLLGFWDYEADYVYSRICLLPNGTCV